jgi:hypothetical protein
MRDGMRLVIDLPWSDGPCVVRDRGYCDTPFLNRECGVPVIASSTTWTPVAHRATLSGSEVSIQASEWLWKSRAEIENDGRAHAGRFWMCVFSCAAGGVRVTPRFSFRECSASSAGVRSRRPLTRRRSHVDRTVVLEGRTVSALHLRSSRWRWPRSQGSTVRSWKQAWFMSIIHDI